MTLFLHIYFVNYFNTAQVLTHKTSQNMEMLACEGGTLLANSVCIPQTYLKGQVPSIPTIVASRIEITNIRDVNDKKMRISLEMYLETLWIDNRLETSQVCLASSHSLTDVRCQNTPPEDTKHRLP